LAGFLIWQFGNLGKNRLIKFRQYETPQFWLTGQPLEYIRLRTVPVLQDSYIFSRKHNVGDTSPSRKEFCVAIRVCFWGSRLQRIGPTSSVSTWSTTDTLWRGQGYEGVPTKAFSQLEIASYRTWSTVRTGKCLFSHTSQKVQLRVPLSPLQTAWTGFDPNLYSSGSSSADPALVEIATARSDILNRGIVTDTMSATPLEPGWWAVHSTPPRLLPARLVPCGWAYRPVGIDCKGIMP